ncbi:hypothetical protein J6590_021610 [Homalodisca vitripennis]|nr:hypothetical protein J6590_021610 [Homalodisca vitripennis]
MVTTRKKRCAKKCDRLLGQHRTRPYQNLLFSYILDCGSWIYETCQQTLERFHAGGAVSVTILMKQAIVRKSVTREHNLPRRHELEHLHYIALEMPHEYSVSEDLPAGQVVATLRASDPDTPGTLSYAVVSGDEGRFELDSSTGTLRLRDSLDRETRDTYRLQVKASDGVQSAETIITIRSELEAVPCPADMAVSSCPVHYGYRYPNHPNYMAVSSCPVHYGYRYPNHPNCMWEMSIFTIRDWCQYEIIKIGLYGTVRARSTYSVS